MRIEIMLKVKQFSIALIANIFVSLMMYLRAPKQTFTPNNLSQRASTVRSVTVASAVPVPAAFWLFGSVLGLLGWMKRKAT